MNPMRGMGLAAVFASAVFAGIIASSNGSAMLAPTPFRTVRRDKCFLVINMAQAPLGLGGGNGRRYGLLRQRLLFAAGNALLLERVAGHDVHDQRGESVIVLRGL